MQSLRNVIHNRFKASSDNSTLEYEPVISHDHSHTLCTSTNSTNSTNATANNNHKSNAVRSVIDARRNRLVLFLIGITCCLVLIPFYISSRDSTSASTASTPTTDPTDLKYTFHNNNNNNNNIIEEEEEDDDDDIFNSDANSNIKSCLTTIENLHLTSTNEKMSREASECINTLTTQSDSLTPPNLSSFSFHLFSTLLNSTDISPQSNVLLSPFSIASALALLLTGATHHSPCQYQLLNTLSITSHLDMAVLHQSLRTSLDTPIHKNHVEFNSANGIWVKGQSILDSYVNLVKQVHRAEAAPLPTTYQPINEFVESNTNHMISNMMEEGEVDPLTVAILVNAVYFKGLWQNSFDSRMTTESSFYVKGGTRSRTPTHIHGKDDLLQLEEGTIERRAKFMFAERNMEVALNVDELNGASFVRLDYGKPLGTSERGGGDSRDPRARRQRMMKKDEKLEEDEDKEGQVEQESEFSAFFILPSKDSQDGIDGVFTQLAKLSQPSPSSSSSSSSSSTTTTTSTTSLPITKILSNTQSQKIKLYLPRFKLISPTTSLNSHLQSLGIKDVFTGSSVLNQMSNDPDVHLSNVLHKAVMEVTEEGTVAAAATVGLVMTRAMPRPNPVLRFDVPFGVLVVYNNKDGEDGKDGGSGYTPLFMGRVTDPEFDF